MKTITITISIQEERIETIKGNIIEQANIALANQALAKKQISQRVNELFKIRETIMAELNNSVGADVWFVRERDERSYNPCVKRNHKSYNSGQCFAIQIGFRDGVYKNTCFNDWDLHIQTPLKEEVVFGEIKYREPVLDIVEMYLVKTHHNHMNNSDISYKIEDISEIHEYLKNDYITYFTQPKK